jgi:type I restriction enzyme M protein
MFWNAGISNPLTAIEQITYLLFLKHLELLDAERIKHGKKSIYADGYESCRWTNIVALAEAKEKDEKSEYELHDLMTGSIFPWLRVLDETLRRTGNNVNTALETGRMMEDAYFQLPREKANTLKTAIGAIDDLFTLDTHSDLMGDVFEELLRGIQSAGKNGQFRTPRHIIRFMVELVNPTPADRIIDPAAGTGGFLFASIQHLLKQAILREAPEDLRLEWDGTPHRLAVPNTGELLQAEQFTGYDNDRTMVRIGWMNMILHGIENPRFDRRDSLGKGLDEEESEKYTVVLANPPFTGNVDTGDLNKRFFTDEQQKKALTNKSELLFLALFLDLLEPDGRAAVIVPEGVLFGSSNAHRELRRCLLFEHNLQAVISLPAGVFQPYTGVKTSILYFRKQRAKHDPKFIPGAEPNTKQVFFYEILDDGFSLDAKRTELNQPGDLPDALDKVEQRSTSTDYVRPHTYADRWRWVDKSTVDNFRDMVPDLAEKRDHDYGIHELFPEFKSFASPNEAPALEAITNSVAAAQTLCIAKTYTAHLRAARAARSIATDKDLKNRLGQIQKAFKSAAREVLDYEDEQHGRKAFDSALDSAHQQAVNSFAALLAETFPADTVLPNDDDLKATAHSVALEFAKLDGYTIWLRSLAAQPVPSEKHPHRAADGRPVALSWLAPVRTLARKPDWQSADGAVIDSHDEQGQVRQEYLDWLKTANKYNEDGTLVDMDLLEPTCLEANDFNLSAGRYKPFALEAAEYGDPKEIIAQLQQREKNILNGLELLSAMMDGRA